ncbi:uncharacterized protein M421DRAFT_9376 [Didymella exigua CBS 183.55]|uniref:Uncharacterized protein n=1 Tax=Didymella exigua CBS 183.55 TaxID=1150837 RepID=A0A6A5R6I0_9PLEO|nr:uncharacterized protein M421DRAFT_9376 [Didymella exigua CBS 183.55]KAF1923761.1 hypothetical protein M421DRAFT_9376 [Didymella exigua CBS 183.55]
MSMDAKLLRSVAACIFKTPFSLNGINQPIFDYTYYLYYQLSLSQKIEKSSLVSLLNRFASKRFADPLDRVFSLLSLSYAGNIQVNDEIPADHLAYELLRNHKGQLCICSVMVVMRALQHEDQRQLRDWEDFYDQGRHDAPWIEFVVPASELKFHRYDSDKISKNLRFLNSQLYKIPHLVEFSEICQFAGIRNFSQGRGDRTPK